MSRRNEYLCYIKAARKQALKNYHRTIEEWPKTIDPHHLFGYNPPELPITLAALDGFLYRLTGESHYAREAVEELAGYHRFTEFYPAWAKAARPEYRDGLPPITNFFALVPYIQAYENIRSSNVVTKAQQQEIQAIIGASLKLVFRFPEWGAHNRTMLRAAGLAAAARVFPDHPQAAAWNQMASILAGDSLGHWSIEDASLYHPIWIYAMIKYAERVGYDLARHPTCRYYFDYFLALLSPAGVVADFGDAQWQASWHYFVACLEWGARAYQDGAMKYAAETIYHTMVTTDTPASPGVAQIFSSAYFWCDEKVCPQQPQTGSQEALEDLFGKKVVFRNGWHPQATFMLLNYKPETDYGRTPRDYLKHTISVEAEKAHHGHAEENAINLLMAQGSVLLHEGGYREELPNGKYRADLYHNRVLIRQGGPPTEQSMLAFLDDGGKYKPVETEKIDFFTFQGSHCDEVDMSRTRVTDPVCGYRWDRCIAYLKRLEAFLVIDGIEALGAGTYTLTSLFYTREILAAGTNYFDTRIDRIGNYANPGQTALLIVHLPLPVSWIGTFETRRAYQQETGLYQTTTRSLQAGDWVVFGTLLWPHPQQSDPTPLVQAVQPLTVDRYPRAYGIQITRNGDTFLVGCKLDLAAEIVPQNIRPRYNFASGAIRYGPVQTDARFCYLRQSVGGLYYAFTEATGLRWNEQPVFQARETAYPLQPEGDPIQNGVAKWRAWAGFYPRPDSD